MDKEKLKIETLLTLLHEENKMLMDIALINTCYPKDYEKTKKEMFADWDKAFQKIMRIGDAAEQHRRDDNCRTDHSG